MHALALSMLSFFAASFLLIFALRTQKSTSVKPEPIKKSVARLPDQSNRLDS